MVSVIIPVYNRPKIVLEALDTVFAQTFSNFECIVVDDGSSDGTAKAMEGMLEKQRTGPSLRLLTVPHSGFPGKVRNIGAREAGGTYLAFLDSDDIWKPEKLARQLELMEKTGAVISHTRETWLRGEREVSQASQRHRRRGNIFTDALKKCIIGPSTVIMRRENFLLSGGFREDIEIAEDYEYWLRVTAEVPVEYLDEPLTVKRAGGWGQLSEKYGHIEYFRLMGLKDLVEGKWLDGLPGEKASAALAELARKCRIYAAGCEKRGKREEAAEYLSLAEKYTGKATGV